MKFKEYKGLDLPGLAADVLKEWDAQDTFHKSISTREGHPTFVFYEGPPSAVTRRSKVTSFTARPDGTRTDCL